MVGKRRKGKNVLKRYKPNRQRLSERVLLRRKGGGGLGGYSKLLKKATLNSFFFHRCKGLNKKTFPGSERHQLVAPVSAAASHESKVRPNSLCWTHATLLYVIYFQKQ